MQQGPLVSEIKDFQKIKHLYNVKRTVPYIKESNWDLLVELLKFKDVYLSALSKEQKQNPDFLRTLLASKLYSGDDYYGVQLYRSLKYYWTNPSFLASIAEDMETLFYLRKLHENVRKSLLYEAQPLQFDLVMQAVFVRNPHLISAPPKEYETTDLGAYLLKQLDVKENLISQQTIKPISLENSNQLYFELGKNFSADTEICWYDKEVFRKLIEKDPRFFRVVLWSYLGRQSKKNDLHPFVPHEKVIKKFMVELLQKDKTLFGQLTETESNDKAVINCFLSDFPEIMEYASPALKKDREFIKKAVYNDASIEILNYVDHSIFMDEEFFRSLRKDGLQFFYAGQKLLEKLSPKDRNQVAINYLKTFVEGNSYAFCVSDPFVELVLDELKKMKKTDIKKKCYSLPDRAIDDKYFPILEGMVKINSESFSCAYSECKNLNLKLKLASVCPAVMNYKYIKFYDVLGLPLPTLCKVIDNTNFCDAMHDKLLDDELYHLQAQFIVCK